ncbi:MAG: hypothetical protein ABEJ03_02085 [Candidatus Nanohaloarchaea archaeon]
MSAATLEDATNSVKSYMADLKGADVEVSGRQLIDWLDFDVLETKKDDGKFLLKVEIKESMFSDRRNRYRVVYNPENDSIEDFARLDDKD